jgi:hypothetical protein
MMVTNLHPIKLPLQGFSIRNSHTKLENSR